MEKKSYKLLKIYVNERTKYEGHNLYHYLTLKLKEMGVAGVTVIQGIEGYGEDKKLHSSQILDLSFDMPIVIEVIDTNEKIEKALDEIKDHLHKGLVTLTDVDVLEFK